MAKQTPLLMRSELTGAVYIVTRYTTQADGAIEALEKYDVTDQFDSLAGRWRSIAGDLWNALDSIPEEHRGVMADTYIRQYEEMVGLR